MKLQLVPYEAVKDKRKGQVEYHRASLRAVPKVKLHKFFDEIKPDSDVLGRALWTELEELVAAKVEGLACYYTTQPAPRHRLFVYAAGRRVTAVETAVAGELATWFTRITENMHRGDHGCIVLVQTQGTGVSALMERDEQELETAPIKVFKRWAPPSFNQADEATRKAKYLAACEKKKGPIASDDPAKVEELLRELAARRKHTVKKSRGDVDARLTALEQLIGDELPAGASAVWRALDGAEGLFFDHDLLSLKQVEAAWRSWRDIFDEWTLEELQGNTEPQPGITQQLYCCPKWIPIIDLVGGHYLAIDLLPGPKGRVGQLIVIGRDVETIRRIAPDMTSFLELCIAYAGGARNILQTVFDELHF